MSLKNTVTDQNRKKFFLGRTICKDVHFYASKDATCRAMRCAIRNRKSRSLKPPMFMYVHRKPTSSERFALMPRIVVFYYPNDSLRLGCHVFGRRATRKILKWAGIEVK